VMHTNVAYEPGGADGGVFFRKLPALASFERGRHPELAAFAEGLEPAAGEPVFTKQYASAFFGTRLAEALREKGIDTLLIAGLSTSGCVRASAVDACQHGFVPLVVRARSGERAAIRALLAAIGPSLLRVARQVLGPGPHAAADAMARAELGAAELAWMATLQPNLPLSDEGIHLCHASPRSDLEYLLDTVEPSGNVRIASDDEVRRRLGGVGAALVLCGHTHHPRSVRTAAGQLLVNPGSVGLQAYDHDDPYLHVIENGSPDARYAIVERVHGEWRALLLAVPYAHEPMARLAEDRGQPDWAYALRTGYMPRPPAA